MAQLSNHFVEFFKELKKNNEREWFNSNKKSYEQYVKAPFEEIVRLTIEKVQKFDPTIQITPKDAIFRIYRDIRFSKDKTPYKTYVSANISRNGRRSKDLGFFLMINAEEISIGGGAYMLDKDQLKKIRSEITYSGKEFRKIIDDKSFKSMFGELKGEKNKIIPREFKEAYGEEPLIANKQFYYMAEYKDKNIITDKNLVDFIVKHFKQGWAINDFLRRAMED
jgi:uncharacterized protein (TIGR02453 family)